MIQDIIFHGRITPAIECFVTVAGRDVAYRYFYEHHSGNGAAILRFFAAGYEVALTEKGIRYNGPGGCVAEYMFGAEQPIQDLVKKEILNRLVMFGAYYDQNRNLVFYNKIEGLEDYDFAFREGNAISNYYFLLPSPFEGDAGRRQEQILRKVGKILKRTPLVGEQRDIELAHTILQSLDEPDAILYLFRLTHINHRRYSEEFKKIYEEHKEKPGSEMNPLEDLASELGLDTYQQHRIRMDVIYHHSQNQNLVEAYKDTLISYAEEGREDARARLQRLRTLSIRYNVPSSLLDQMDELLLTAEARTHAAVGEADYVQRTREILTSLFMGGEAAPHAAITPHDIKEILTAKKQATEEHNNSFEEVLLDTGRLCDELAAEKGDITPLENFGSVVTYLDRFDSAIANLNRLAFMDDSRIGSDKIRSILGNKQEFDNLEKNFFETLFVQPIIRNKYVPFYGRKKVLVLKNGLRRIEEGIASMPDIAQEISVIADEERVYHMVHHALKQRIRSFYYSDLRVRAALEPLRRELSQELQSRGQIKDDIPTEVFDRVVLDIQKEAFYIQHLLPQVIESKDAALREDFIINSGLDRFYIEELENEYLRAAEIGSEILDSVRGATI